MAPGSALTLSLRRVGDEIRGAVAVVTRELRLASAYVCTVRADMGTTLAVRLSIDLGAKTAIRLPSWEWANPSGAGLLTLSRSCMPCGHELNVLFPGSSWGHPKSITVPCIV